MNVCSFRLFDMRLNNDLTRLFKNVAVGYLGVAAIQIADPMDWCDSTEKKT